MTDYVIGFDAGGTRLKSGAVTRGGRIRATSMRPTSFGMVPKRLMAALRAEVKRISAEMGGPPKAMAIGFPGAVHPDKGVVFLPGKIKGLEGYPIVKELRKATGVPVVADNDGRLSIYAESQYGLAKDVDWAVTITLGTGVGSGVKLDGRILRDPHLMFGTQMSHIVQEGSSGRLCITGARGTAEMRCSATALAMNMRDALQRGIPSSLSDQYFEDPASVDFEAVIKAVSRKDRLATEELTHWTTELGWLLVSAVHVYAPQKIILSGGASNGAKYFLEPLRKQVNAHLFRYPPKERVPIELSRIRNHQGVLGAAALAWERADSEG